MNSESLDNLVKINKLHRKSPDAEEINGLIRSGTVRLNDARLESLNIETAAKWRVLDQAHQKRNQAEYEGEIDLSPALVQSILKIAEEIEEAVLRITGD